jgi:ubiquinone/menaquinone biosynthesis C-methylase UbiE
LKNTEVQAIIDNELSHWWYKERRHKLKKFLSTISVPARVLDLGPAGGFQTQLAGEIFGSENTFALEYNFAAAKVCKGRIPLTINGDGETLPLKSSSFDVVICMDTLEHIKYDSKVIKELFRILQAGGFAFISVPSLQVLWSNHDISVGHFRRYEKKQLMNLFEKESFQIINIEYFNVLLFPLMLISRVLGFYGKDSEVEGDHKTPNKYVNYILGIIIKIERIKIFKYFYGSSLFVIVKKL